MTGHSNGLELYVYYKLEPAQAQPAQRAFALASQGQTELQVELRQREDAHEALLTWMEIYRGPPAAIAALEAQVAEALRPFIQGARHLERFRPLPGPQLTAP
ncbi:DUF4936 family protein [Paucibacter sp. Y2R2-4]|uniref:DUF4936 family protein n=1 Tax=Paucibacter sp. Y2R2-4 TaxID=2893553 RepID=UPI0021E4DC20|nr:DUF4936 family protein [Paucibacter sp. Y2R2-4]MCV2348269.1 DUF4936 family protein [Paucibacter sp. Y2R2-4]